MSMADKGVVLPATTPRGIDTNANAEQDADTQKSSGQGAAGEPDLAEVAFIGNLDELGVALWVGDRNPRWPDHGDEFFRPKGWQDLTSEGNGERLGTFSPGKAICANTGGRVAVFDVDPRNGGDIEKVRSLLHELNVRIYGEVVTPGHGRHFFVPGHPALRTVHSNPENPRLPGFPGVDIQTFRCNVFLPFTQRPKYQGRGYAVVSDDLKELASLPADAGEPVARWVGEQLAKHAQKTARPKDKKDYFDLPVAPPWSGDRPDKRQQAYLDKVLEDNAKKVATAKPGGRNEALFLAALKCGSFIAGAGMDEVAVVDTLARSAMDCGLADDDGAQSVQATIASGLKIGSTNPRAVPAGSTDSGGHRREIVWTSLTDIDDAAPQWAWKYDGCGRIQVAALTLFGGRPATGKSTAARWFAARFSRGELEGCWKGKPRTVAYIAAEETAKYVLKPALRAAGADMDRIVTPTVRTAGGKHVALLADEDEHRLTEDLVKQNVSVIIVDPVMATIKSQTDIYRSNELRESLDPWLRIAEAIDGIVIGIVHFVKSATGDLIASINGGSAFGEVARCVFGFAKEDSPVGSAPLRVMSQGKNSCGREGLSLEFAIESKWVTVSTGEDVEVGTFVLGEESDVSAGELLTPRRGPRPLSLPMQLVLDHVNQQEGVVTPMEVFHAMLAKDNKAAGQMLNRLSKRGLILNPRQGEYRRFPDSSLPSEETRSPRVGEEVRK